MKESMGSVATLLEKISDTKDIIECIDLVLTFVAEKDKKTRVKFYLVKAKCLSKAKSTKETKKKISEVLELAHNLCKNDDGTDNQDNANILLDVYGMKILRADEEKNSKLLKRLFTQAQPLLQIGLANNNVLGTIYRCGGRSNMRDHNYAAASSNFFDAFKNFDEGNNSDMLIESLKLLVFSTILGGSRVNPFDDTRTKVHTSKTEVKNYERLMKDVINKDIESFERSIKPMMRDDVVNSYVPELRRLVQKDVFLQLVRPYTTLHISFIAQKIKANEVETEQILVELLLANQVKGSINQRAGIIKLHPDTTASENYYSGLYGLSGTVNALSKSVMQMVN